MSNFDKNTNIYNNDLNIEPKITTINNNDFHNEKIYRFLKKILILMNIESNFVKIFGIDKLIIPFLIILKNWISRQIPELNKLIFKEKTASLTITYTHFTSTYYNQQNNSSSDYLVYKSILCYVYDKKPIGCKFSTNPNGGLMFFEPFDEVQINKNICLISKNVPSNTSSIYVLELISYILKIDKINDFIKNCVEKYKNKIQNESNISSSIKYYKYLGLNNSTHQCMYDEYPFTQTKTFSNIFFEEKDNLVNKIKYFTKNELVYKTLGIPYCMGIILHGKPGTGKTSCIKAIASMTKRHIIDVSLKKIKTHKELSEIFYGTKINGNEIGLKSRLYVLEEFDCIIERLMDRKLKSLNSNNNLNFSNNQINLQNHSNTFQSYQNYNQSIYKNKNIDIQHNQHNQNKNIDNQNNQNQILYENDSDGITLENLLTLLDGCVEQNGNMFIATTNHLDLIDKALIRPGRFDICLYLDNASENIIIQMIEHFSKKNLKKLTYQFEKLLKITKSETSETLETSETSEISKKTKITKTSKILETSKTLKKFKSSKSSKFNKKNKKEIENSVDNSNLSINRSLTKEQINKINILSKYNNQFIWSPAKISQICLFNINKEDYYQSIILDLEKQYNEQVKLL